MAWVSGMRAEMEMVSKKGRKRACNDIMKCKKVKESRKKY